MPDILKTNSGVLIREPEASDFMMGALDRPSLQYQENVPDGDWLKYLPTTERQSSKIFDTMACVTFSGLNSIETQLNRLIMAGLMLPGDFKWLFDNGYFGADGKVNLSDRFTAKMSHTSKNGNFLTQVADSIRHDGCVPESKWPWTETFDWDAYYADIPADIIALGLEFAARFITGYEWIATGPGTSKGIIFKALTHAPLQLATQVCSGWSTEPVVQNCQLEVQHATLLYGYDGVSDYEIFDQYDPFYKMLAPDYTIPFILKHVIMPAAGLITNNTDMTDQETLDLMYQLGFKRMADAGAQGYLGRPIKEVLQTLVASEENKAYTSLFAAGKGIEAFGASHK